MQVVDKDERGLQVVEEEVEQAQVSELQRTSLHFLFRRNPGGLGEDEDGIELGVADSVKGSRWCGCRLQVV